MKRAFTLAEVLITLVITGVVAALALPGLFLNNEKQQLTKQFQKTFVVIIQAVQMSQIENGELGSWDYSSLGQDEFARKYIIPYFIISKDCGLSPYGCFAKNTTYKFLNGVDDANWDEKTDFYKFTLADGSALAVKYQQNCTGTSEFCFEIEADVNGAKAPNQFGRDMFRFRAYPRTNNIQPYGIYGNNYVDGKWEHMPKPDIYSDCSETGMGLTCGARVVLDGNSMLY